MLNKITKKQFKYRMLSIYSSIIIWSITGPVLKTYFNLLPSVLFSILGLWIMVVSLSQKWLRENYSIISLMKGLIVIDILYAVIIGVLNYNGNIKSIIIVDFVMDGFYTAFLIATSDKLQSYYIGKFKPDTQDRIRATIMNRKQYSAIAGLVLAGIVSLLFNVYEIIWLKLMGLGVVMYFEINSIKK